jgi:hypothetical protein
MSSDSVFFIQPRLPQNAFSSKELAVVECTGVVVIPSTRDAMMQHVRMFRLSLYLKEHHFIERGGLCCGTLTRFTGEQIRIPGRAGASVQ